MTSSTQEIGLQCQEIDMTKVIHQSQRERRYFEDDRPVRTAQNKQAANTPAGADEFDREGMGIAAKE